MMMRRRRPLMRAAMVGGAGYMAGKSVARGSERESEQEQRLAELEAQQQPVAMAPPPAPAPAPAPAAGGDLVSKLQQLKQLQDEGVLTADEFAAAKAQLLAG
jgi:putative oligomerization/nucleic acid binding protein